MFNALLKQEINLKKFSSLANPMIFFFIAISIFAFSIQNLSGINLNQLNISLIWFCLTFSIMLGLGNIFKEDFEDGTLEQLFLSGEIFELIIAVKILANWLIYCLPIIIILPLFSFIFNLGNPVNLVIISIIISLIISLIVSFCASLLLLNNSAQSLLTILVLPLTIPAIIFANSALSDYESFFAAFKFLLALLVFILPIMIYATSLVIKLNIRE
jgi:heme exporter protein B